MESKSTAISGAAVRRASLCVGLLTAVLAYGGSAAAQDSPAAARKTDTELTQRIRRSLSEDETVSAFGKHVKVSTLNGKVTLNGVVRTEVEKQQIGQKAASVAGPDNVINALEITPAQ